MLKIAKHWFPGLVWSIDQGECMAAVKAEGGEITAIIKLRRDDGDINFPWLATIDGVRNLYGRGKTHNCAMRLLIEAMKRPDDDGDTIVDIVIDEKRPPEHLVDNLLISMISSVLLSIDALNEHINTGGMDPVASAKCTVVIAKEEAGRVVAILHKAEDLQDRHVDAAQLLHEAIRRLSEYNLPALTSLSGKLANAIADVVGMLKALYLINQPQNTHFQRSEAARGY